jgi:hypothetical protein
MAGFGLKILRSSGPDGYTGNSAEFPISPSNTGKIFTGDAVRLSSGFVIEATGGADNDDFTILGVFQGVRYVDVDGSFVFKKYWDGVAGRTDIRAMVALPEGATFLIKGMVGATYTQANIGSRYGLDYTIGSEVYGDSRVRLAAAAAGTGPLLLQRLVRAPRNAFNSVEPLFEVSVVRRQVQFALA